MQINLPLEDQEIVEKVLAAGTFESAEQVLHAALMDFQETYSPEYIAYVRAAIAEADADPRPSVDVEAVFAELLGEEHVEKAG